VSRTIVIIAPIFATCEYHFQISTSALFFTVRIRTVIAIIIRYPQIGNEPVLKAFKIFFTHFLVFWASFEKYNTTLKICKIKKKKEEKKG
jgi:hypothetical protein